jgi:threonine aldolase
MTPEPPLHSFASDNVAGAHPDVIEAIAAANAGSALPYGEDPWTARAVARVREQFGEQAEVFFTYGGTGANVAALQTLLLPHQSVICPTNAHINTDECGAPERFTGAKLVDVPTEDGKLRPDDVRPLLGPTHGEHNMPPAVLAISQVTEFGTVYAVEEIAALAELAHAHGLVLFVDGARLANAAASLECPLREMTADAGVDVVTFGGTKNGILYGEAIVYLRPELAARARFARKQAGQLASKMRFISAQFEALLTGELWLENARHANEMATRLADAVGGLPGVVVPRAPQANSLFVQLPAAVIPPLQEWSFFWEWDEAEHLVRWMTSFATTDEDVARFAGGLRHLIEQR